MQETRFAPRTRKRGVVASEFVLLFFLILVLLIALANLFTDGEGASVPSYRMANAIYAHGALERQRVGVMSYLDTYGSLPGDDSRPETIDDAVVSGNEDGKIDPATMEPAKVFYDLVANGTNAKTDILVRGRPLELLWVRLLDGDTLLLEDNFFRIKGFHVMEARGIDRRFDDDVRSGGNVLYFDDEDGDDATVTLYYRLVLLR